MTETIKHDLETLMEMFSIEDKEYLAHFMGGRPDFIDVDKVLKVLCGKISDGNEIYPYGNELVKQLDDFLKGVSYE